MPGATFALDPRMLDEYAYLPVPRELAPAKAILKARYGDRRAKSARSVYEGCSGGGRQGLIQAQRPTAIAVTSPPPMHRLLRSEQRDEDARTGRADGMPERTGAAVGVDALMEQIPLRIRPDVCGRMRRKLARFRW
jgi:hypothetical protein